MRRGDRQTSIGTHTLNPDPSPFPCRIIQEQKAAYFGEHQGITCDGCGAEPIIGYRYRCKKCANHDICEACHERWDNGKGSMANGLAKQTISLDPKDHDFFVHKERGFKPLVKTVGPTKKSEKKLKVRPAPSGFITASFCKSYASHTDAPL